MKRQIFIAVALGLTAAAAGLWLAAQLVLLAASSGLPAGLAGPAASLGYELGLWTPAVAACRAARRRRWIVSLAPAIIVAASPPLWELGLLGLSGLLAAAYQSWPSLLLRVGAASIAISLALRGRQSSRPETGADA
jgi:hypothetical protein